jgi:hypothetical protein
MRHTLSLLLLAFSLTCFSQDYMTKIAEKSCDCMKNVSDTLAQDRLYMELGVCMLSASEPYKKQLKKEHDINLERFDGTEGEKLGQVVGLKMATVCPDVLLAFTKKTEANNNKTKVEDAEKKKFTGKVIKIDEEAFISFTVKDNEGKAAKFYWLTYVESGFEMVTRYESLMSVDIRISYHTLELFDAKTKEYRSFNIIDKVDQLSR